MKTSQYTVKFTMLLKTNNIAASYQNQSIDC